MILVQRKRGGGGKYCPSSHSGQMSINCWLRCQTDDLQIIGLFYKPPILFLIGVSGGLKRLITAARTDSLIRVLYVAADDLICTMSRSSAVRRIPRRQTVCQLPPSYPSCPLEMSDLLLCFKPRQLISFKMKLSICMLEFLPSQKKYFVVGGGPSRLLHAVVSYLDVRNYENSCALPSARRLRRKCFPSPQKMFLSVLLSDTVPSVLHRIIY